MRAKVYLSGPIKDRSDEEIHGWREDFKRIYGAEDCYDPSDRVYRVIDDWQTIVRIVEADKIDIVRSDVVLVFYDKPSAGTCMEIIYGWTMGKMVVVVCDNDEVQKSLSPWILYHATFITTTLQAAMIYIEDYYGRY